MLCKVCNTRVPREKSSCPNCGSPAPSEALTRESVGMATLPRIELPAGKAETVDEDAQFELDAELDAEFGADHDAERDSDLDRTDSLELVDEEPSDDEGVFDRDDEAKENEPVTQPASRVQVMHPLGKLDASGVRRMLVERPEMLEADLSVYKSEKGTPLGAGYTSGVGEIDLLARDRSGDLVVVMVAEPREGADIISVMLQRIGWVRKHLSRDARPVRGIVLLDEMREDLAYAASAVSDTITFKSYRIALAFEDIVP
jgi:hypothetical protein